MTKIIIEAVGFQELSADLGEVPKNAGKYIRQAVEYGAVNVKNYWRADLPKEGAAKALPYAIGYDIYSNSSIFHDVLPSTDEPGTATTITADIGPDKNKRQGALGNLLEYGSINNPAEGEGSQALEDETEDFQHGLEKAIDDAQSEVDL